MKLDTILQTDNLVSKLSQQVIDDISIKACAGYEIDKTSREEWDKKTKEAKKIAKQVWEQKDYPFDGASNVKYPLLAVSSIQFAARAYPNFVKAPDVVRGLVIGDDPGNIKASIADRISRHMSYQILVEMEEWEEDTDKLLTVLPISGLAYKKTWFSSELGRNVSEYRSAWDVVINYWAKSINTVPRITEEYILYPNEIEERIRSGFFADEDYGQATSVKDDEGEVNTSDPDQPHVLLEQHTFLDLDNDGYKEPYIICIHKDSKKIFRISKRFTEENLKFKGDKLFRIDPDNYYTKFSFMPSLDGSFYDFGYGTLLTPINKTIDTTLNQLIDSGTLYNNNSGFIGKGIQLGRGRGGGNLNFKLGEWKPVGFSGDDLRKNILPLPVKEPSQVLFALLGFMVSAGEKLSSVTEILTGQQNNDAERPTTTLARIEQGLTVFSSIHKRLYKAFRQEYKKLFRLNERFLNPEEYFTILDTKLAVKRTDYNSRSCDVVPIADPNETTSTQKLIKAQSMMELLGKGYNDEEIKRMYLEALQIPNVDRILNAPEAPPDPKMVIEMKKLELENMKFQFEVAKYDDERTEISAKVQKTIAQAIQAIANAEAAEAGTQLDGYKLELQAITEKMNNDRSERMAGMEKQPGNGGGVQAPTGASGGIGPNVG